MNTIKSLFAGGGQAAPAAPKEHRQEMSGYQVYATPIKEGPQYRLAGRIEKAADEGVMVRNFIRADLFTSEDDAVETAFRKAQQIIDQSGPGLFADGAAQRQV